LNTKVSQGSVATFVKSGGIFNHHFITNLGLVLRWRNVDKQSTFCE